MKQRKRKMRSGVTSTGSRQVTTHLPAKLHGWIARRAATLELTEGSYLATIVRAWFAEGAPPVNDYEARVLAEEGAARRRLDDRFAPMR